MARRQPTRGVYCARRCETAINRVSALRPESTLSLDDPARIMALHADVRVIRLRLRCRQQNECGVKAGASVCPVNQLASNPLSLKGLVHREVG
jgi:hypothetical protein